MAARLNPEQKVAVEHNNGPLLIVAGAGTGKTTVITERIKNLITEKKVAPDHILALTFTEKAAKEMEDRVDKIMPYGYTEMWISTFHSFCDMLLKQEALSIGLPEYRLINQGESILLLKKNIFKFKLDYYRPLGNPTKFLEALLNHFSRLKDEDITPDEYSKYVSNLKDGATVDEEQLSHQQLSELAHAYEVFEKIKITEGFLDFGDLISQTLRLLRTRKNILKKYQDKFEYILVDEFQDTNFAQNELAILLSGEKKNITVVADDDQAIYRWRGAALSNVMQFKENFPGAKVVSLTRNYRSTQEILDRSYEMIQHNNPNRLEITEKISKKLISERNIKGEKIEVLFENRLDAEAECIGNKIRELMEKKGYGFSDFAILVRANNHAQPISSYLERQNIPFQFLGPGQLFQQEEIKDLIAYLKILTDLTDSISLFRVISMDIFGIPQRDLNYLLNISKKKNLTLFETFGQIDDTYITETTIATIGKIHEMIIKHLNTVKAESAGQILYNFLVDTGIYKKLLSTSTQQEESISLNIAKFFDKLKNYEYQEDNSGIYAVVEWIDLMMQIGDSPIVGEIDTKDLNAVSILTVHSSKGLEFPVVFIVNLVNDRFPGRERREKIPIPEDLLKTKNTVDVRRKEIDIIPANFHLQEERRLFYVAMTRAKDKLFLTGAKFYGEGKREKKPSPFITEAVPGFINKPNIENAPEQLSLLDLEAEYKERKAIKEEIVKPEIKSISFSQMQTFDICPLHYKARYILGIPTAPSSAQSYGITLHHALNDFYKEALENKKVDKKSLENLLKKNWISEGYQDKEHEKEAKERAHMVLNTYFDNFFSKDNLPIKLELPFSFHLDNGVKVVGSMDRIDNLKEGGIEIIDYKTGKINASSKSKYKFQLGIYALAATKIKDTLFNHNLEKILVSLLYIETGEKITHSITQKELSEIEEKIIKKVKEIEESDFKCNKNMLCENCEYSMLCSIA